MNDGSVAPGWFPAQGRRNGGLGLMGHVITDYPSPEAVRAMIATMAASGVEIIEVQIPFSEPMADGPVFLAANHQALAHGVSYQASLTLMAEVSRAHPQVRLVFMSYLNPVYRRGYQTFVAEARAAGAAGVIIPDLPVEYAQELEKAGGDTFANIRLAAPNADAARLQQVCDGARGLIYAVARAGVTGATSDFEPVRSFVGRLRQMTQLPVAVGFGVRTPDNIRQLLGLADYAVVGTAALQAYAEGGLEGVV